MKRRQLRRVVTDPVPDWLVRFVPSDWIDLHAQPPPWFRGDDPYSPTWWHHLQARRRWSEAGKAWLAERGCEQDWFSLVHPETARNCGVKRRISAPAATLPAATTGGRS